VGIITFDSTYLSLVSIFKAREEVGEIEERKDEGG
jgi:hypothetical protein